jgi:Tfp pilus assembly protein PilV
MRLPIFQNYSPPRVAVPAACPVKPRNALERSEPFGIPLAWRGFSLVEVVIALGVVSFAVLAIVGMLPVALKSAQDSMRETDATLIAQRIFAEIKTGTGTNRRVCTDSNNGFITINLAVNGSNRLAFSENGTVFFQTTSRAANPSVDFFAAINIFTNTGLSNLSRVQIDVSAPGAAPETQRTTNSFTTLLGY